MEELGIELETLTLNQLGKAKKVTIDKDNTTIVEGTGKSSTSGPHREIRAQIENTTSRLRPREAPGATRQALRRRGPDQSSAPRPRSR